MSDKPKRKHHYRRWWAFRGLLIALILFLGAIGYLFTREPEAEYVIYQLGHREANRAALVRVDVNTGTSEYLMFEIGSGNAMITDVVEFRVSSDGQTIAYSEYKSDTGMRVYIFSIQTRQRRLLFDCAEWYGNCHLEALNSNGTTLTFRTITGETSWYEIDIISGKMLILAQSIHGCGAPENRSLYQSIAVNYVCGSHGTYEFLNLETGDVTTLADVSELTLADDAIHYAYTIASDVDFNQFGYPLPSNVYVGQMSSESSKRLIGQNVANILEDWHPDNQRLLVSRHTVEYDADGGWEFLLCNAKTGAATSLLYVRDANLSQAQWNADGTKIVFEVNTTDGIDPIGITEIWVYDLASGEISVIGHGGQFPQWVN